MAKDTKRERFDENHFVFPPPVQMLTFLMILLYSIVVLYDPNIIPPSLGFIRTMSFYLAEHMRWIPLCFLRTTVIVHFFEATYAWKLCSDAGMTSSATVKWILSTAVFGGISVLFRLRPYLKRFKQD